MIIFFLPLSLPPSLSLSLSLFLSLPLPAVALLIFSCFSQIKNPSNECCLDCLCARTKTYCGLWIQNSLKVLVVGKHWHKFQYLARECQSDGVYSIAAVCRRGRKGTEIQEERDRGSKHSLMPMPMHARSLACSRQRSMYLS